MPHPEFFLFLLVFMVFLSFAGYVLGESLTARRARARRVARARRWS